MSGGGTRSEKSPLVRDRVVLVNETTEHVATTDAKRWGIAGGPVAGQRHTEVESSVRAVLVVVADVLAKDHLQMTSADHEHPVKAFGSNRPDPAFCERIGPRRSDRRLDHPDALGSEHLVEAGRELGIPVPDQELDGPAPIEEITGEVAGHLGDEGPGRMVGDPEDLHLPGRAADHEENVELAQRHGVTVKKSMASTPWAWERKKSGHVGPFRGTGPRPWRRRTRRTEPAETLTPSLRSSPWMRHISSDGSPDPDERSVRRVHRASAVAPALVVLAIVATYAGRVPGASAPGCRG